MTGLGPGWAWGLLALTLFWWVTGAAAVFVAYRYAFRIHTLWRGMVADVDRGRPPAPPEIPVIAAAIELERHRHAQPRRQLPRPRLPRIRLRRRDPFPELPQDQDHSHDDTVAWLDGHYLPAPTEVLALPAASCPFCQVAECARCGGCVCPRVARCECTQTAITAVGGGG